MNSTGLLRSAAVVALCVVAVPAGAQMANEATEQTRLQANRAGDAQSSQLEQVGARAGAFRVLPRIEVGVLRDDNVYAADDNTRSDTVYRVAPALLLTADTSRYVWNIRADLERLEFDNFNDESRTNYGAGTNINTEVVRDTRLVGRLNYDVSHEDRGDPNSLQSNVEPVRFKTFDSGIGFDRTASRAIFGVDAAYKTLNYNDVRRNNNTIDNNDDRDRELTLIGGKLGYEFSPGYNLLVRAAYDTVNYDQNRDDLGFDRDSKGFRLTGGVGFELTRLLTGDIFAGYISRNYDDARFETINEPTFGASLTWSPNELTAVRISADRTIEETVFAGYNGFVNTTAAVRVEHELTRQLVLNGGVRYAKNKYVLGRGSTAARRDDDNYGANIGLRYSLNRLLYAGASYEYNSRNSNVADTDFDRNKFLLTLGAQF